MSLVFNSKTYINDVPRSPDIMRYLGPGHSNSANDFMDLGRTAPKPTATYAGKSRVRAKLTRTATDGTAPVGDAIGDLSFSLPVGMQESEMDAFTADLGAFVVAAAYEAFWQDRQIVF